MEGARSPFVGWGKTFIVARNLLIAFFCAMGVYMVYALCTASVPVPRGEVKAQLPAQAAVLNQEGDVLVSDPDAAPTGGSSIPVGEQMDDVGSVEEVERGAGTVSTKSQSQPHPAELVGVWNLMGALDLTLDGDGVCTAMGKSGSWHVKGRTLVIDNPGVSFRTATYSVKESRLQLNYVDDMGRPDVMHLRKVN
jgi:hypothetical protein